MRADRLLSLLMLLQARGTMTAGALAGELEVSERTIYRDVEALSMAGVPVYAERGPGGGISLLDSYRTTLTGLNEAEVRALFALSVPAPLADLGIDRELKAALLKLVAALPAARRAGEESVRQRIHLDFTPWQPVEAPVTHLRTLHEAVWQERLVELTHSLPFGARLERLVAPLGLVAKAGDWYLVCRQTGSIRVVDLRRVLAVRLCEETFARPAAFDLVTFWEAWRKALERNQPCYRVTARLAGPVLPYLPRLLGDSLAAAIELDAPAADGWVRAAMTFESLEAARSHLLGLGGAVEVLAPRALRLTMADFARQTLARYDPARE